MTKKSGWKQKNSLKWILTGVIAAVVMAVALIAVTKGKVSEDDEIPSQVYSAADAIALLRNRAEDLGYQNALDELTELYSVTVEGDSYYRLQQNYWGIPVYGRSIVYAADENGELLSLTQNVRDISGGVNLTPTVQLAEARFYLLKYLAETYPESEWAEYFANEDYASLPEFTLDPDSLYVYDFEETARLVYEIYLEGLCFLIDAHTGEVVYVHTMANTVEAIFKSTGEKINAGQLEDGTYVLSDEDMQTYVFTVDGRTFYNNRANNGKGSTDSSQLMLVTSENNIFGDLDDSVSRASMERGRKYLQCVNEVRNVYRGYNFDISEKIILIYDDQMGRPEGDSAYRMPEKLRYDGITDGSEEVVILGLGTKFSEEPAEYIDVIAHEYTHQVTDQHIGWVYINEETKILNESCSDIMGELIQAQCSNTDPDWKIASRIICDPKSVDYPTVAWEYGHYDLWQFDSGKMTDNAHFYSTVISHAAYKMWSGYPEIPDSAINTDDMARLWYTSMLRMPADADFADCRHIVETSAKVVGLSENQRLGIAKAFDEAGIAATSQIADVDFQVQEVCCIDILDADNSRCTDCEVIVRKAGAAYGPHLPTDSPIRWNSNDSERCNLKLDPGFYTLTVTVHGEPETVESYDIQVTESSEAVREIGLYMNRGKVLFDVEVLASGGREKPVPGARIEVYRNNPSELVYFGELNEHGDGLRLYLKPDNYTVIATARGYEPGQVHIEMPDTSVRYSQTLLLESAEETIPADMPSAPAEITGGAPYKILTWERTHTGQTDGITWTNAYRCDYIVLLGDDPAYEVINRSLYELASQAMNTIDDEVLYNPQYDYAGLCENYGWHMSMKVLHNGNGIISILLGNGRAVTYSLSNGAQLGLYTLAGDYEEAYLKTLNSFFDPYAWQADELGDFNFSSMAVVDGEIVILRSSGICYTGLYVSTECTERLQGTMRAIGGTGSVAYEIQELNRYFKRLGAPACLQELRQECRYPVLSGTPGCGRINQEVYELAEQFMAAMPEERTYTSDKFFFDWWCNASWGDPVLGETEGIEYNKNGIVSYVMDWIIDMSYFKNGQDIDGYEFFNGYYCIVYDLETGEHLSLPQITGMDEQTQLRMLKDAYYRTIHLSYNSILVDLRGQPVPINLSDPEFLIADDGQIYLVYSWTKEPSEGVVAEGWRYRYESSQLIPTGLFILDS